VMDSFISLNTIYHIPKDEQLTAIKELYRVLAAKGKGVVVYEWFKHSQWMNIGLLPFHSLVSMKNSIVDNIAKLAGNKKTKRILYYYAHNPNYFKQNLPPFQLKVWRSVSVHFMRYYIHSWLFGKQILQWIYDKEEANTELCGLKGEYPMLVFEK
jgi:ubiquinone/menaquinone biosynthesis C-methylase UbiE